MSLPALVYDLPEEPFLLSLSGLLSLFPLPSFSSAFSQSNGGGAQLEDPAHLDLIALAMCKLWNMFGPCRNYFGEKDWQQLVMFQCLAFDLEYPVEVLGDVSFEAKRGEMVDTSPDAVG